MKMSKLFVQTLREFPSDAEVISHKMLVRAGYIRKLTSGVYNYLPLMWRVLRKVETIVREEMDNAGFTMEKIRQGVFTLSEPMKQLEADLKNHIVIYDNNPVLKWCLSNTQAKVDVNGNIQPSKLNSKFKRIDGAVALIIAYAVLNTHKKDYESMIS